MRKVWKRWLLSSAAAFTLAAAMPVFAAETVDVTVKNVRGGYLSVSYYDEAAGYSKTLPIDKTVQVPAGTRLYVNARANDYYPSKDIRWDAFVQSVSSNGEELEGIRYTAGNMNANVNVEANEDLTLEAVFKAYEKKVGTSDEPEWTLAFKDESHYSTYTGMMKPGAFQEQLYLYDENNEKTADYKVEDVHIEYANYDSWSGDYEDLDGMFTISETGMLSASENLKQGTYSMEVYFTHEGEELSSYLDIEVGTSVYIANPRAFYKRRFDSKSYGVASYSYARIPVENPANLTFGDALKMEMIREGDLVGCEMTGVGLLKSGSTSLQNASGEKISSRIGEKSPTASVYAMFKDYTAPIVEPLTQADVLPKELQAGWNEIGGVYYFYETKDSSSLVKNSWVPCRDNDGEYVWVGSDGALVTNGVVKDGAVSYLVDANGHKRLNATVTVGDVDYVTDETGAVVSAKVHLATPSNAESVLSHVDKVLSNKDNMTEEELVSAADMLTEALKKIDTSKLTSEEAAKYTEVYYAAYGEENIIAEDPSLILAAGLTSADFANGTAVIGTDNAWLASSSNAQAQFEIKLIVNGEERKALAAPIELTIDLPDYFVASYSNASYNFKVSPAPLSFTVDTDNGVLTIKISALGTYKLQAVPKKSHGGSGSGWVRPASGRASVTTDNAAAKTGQWIQNEKGWWFRYFDGTWPAGQWVELSWNGVTNWYYFNADGYMADGWKQDGGHWYYLHPYSDGSRGYMYTGWHEINGKWYYFNTQTGGPKGSMAVSTTTPDGYTVNDQGEWV